MTDVMKPYTGDGQDVIPTNISTGSELNDFLLGNTPEETATTVLSGGTGNGGGGNSVGNVSGSTITPGTINYFGNSNRNMFIDLLDFKFKPEPSGVKFIAQLPEQVVLWQLMFSASHPSLNELFFDMNGPVGQELPTVFLRPYAYTFKGYTPPLGALTAEMLTYFMDLPEVAIDYSQIVGMNIGLSDHDRNNICYTAPVTATKNSNGLPVWTLWQNGTTPALMIKNSIKRYGIRVNQDVSDFSTIQLSASTFLGLLTDINLIRVEWFKNDQCFMDGSLTILGNPEVRIGKRLKISFKESEHKYDQHYYIVAYTDSWQFPGVWTQTLAVNRGIFLKDNKETFMEEVEDDQFIAVPGSTIGGIQR